MCIRDRIIRDKDDCHTLQLNVMFSSDMIGESIECIHDNGTAQTLIGNVSLNLTTGILLMFYAIAITARKAN